MGGTTSNTDIYKNVTIRTQIIEQMSELPNTSMGGFVSEYHELLGESVFCLAPRGKTPWTVHLYVAIL